jgi:hypothetical protein
MALVDSLTAYYSLEESSGTRADAHGSSPLSTLVGTPGGTTGKVANCTTFSGTSQSLSAGDTAALSTGDIDFSIACWVYFVATSGTPFIIAKWRPTATQSEYVLFYNSSTSRFEFRVSSTGANETAVVANNFGAASTSTWYFVVAWHDSVGNTIQICVNDGTPNSTSYSSGLADRTAEFALASYYHNSSNYLNGRLDEVGFWKKVLSAAEITELYNSGNGRDYAYISAVAAGQPAARRSGLIDYIQPLEIGRSNVRII